MSKSNNKSKPQNPKKSYHKITERRVKSKFNQKKKRCNELKIKAEKETNPILLFREQEWKRKANIRRKKNKAAQASRRIQRRAKKGLRKVA